MEFDENLAKNLHANIAKMMKIREENLLEFDENFAKNLIVEHTDFLQFDLEDFAKNLDGKSYKIVANIPYNITKPIITKIVESMNPPVLAALLVQREVAEKVAAKAGDFSVLSLRIQNFSDAKTGIKVSRKFFTPEPKVESQMLILRPRKVSQIREFFDEKNLSEDVKVEVFAKKFWQIVNAGFANKRKKLHTSLNGIFAKTKDETAEFLREIGIDSNLRAQDLTFENWLEIAQEFFAKK